MKRIILAPDSFKGTMSAIKVCNIMEGEIKRHFPDMEVVKIPVADGGEGTVDCFLEALGGSRINLTVCGPLFAETKAFYGILPDGNTAVIEMAAAAGLPLTKGRNNPAATTTYGVGQLIRNAVENGCRKIIIGLGGSATNDGGAGMAAALGIRFIDALDCEFIPVGGTLDRVARIDTEGLVKELADCEITGMCDVDNPLYGEYGAARIYGPQKGADEECIVLLDKNLEYFSSLLKQQLGIDIAHLPGTGAAGGLGAGIMAFLKAGLKSGIDTVLDTVGFNNLLQGTDLVITGEGRIDGQSLRGKVVVGIAGRAKEKGIPLIAVVGDIGDDIQQVYSKGVTAVVSINRVAVPFEKAAARCETDLSCTMDTIMRLLKIQLN
jgi:glycerate kinase